MTSLPTPSVGDVWGAQLNSAITERGMPTGGATSKALVKASSTDYDATWQTAVLSVVAGTNVTVDNTDPAHPVVSSTSSGGGAGGVLLLTMERLSLEVRMLGPSSLKRLSRL